MKDKYNKNSFNQYDDGEERKPQSHSYKKPQKKSCSSDEISYYEEDSSKTRNRDRYESKKQKKKKGYDSRFDDYDEYDEY